MMDDVQGMLVLEDGSTFTGQSVGAQGERVGEVVFNTGMTGYQEAITDPSLWGQMLTFTCPHIGNVGVNQEDVESRRPFVRAVLARKICSEPSNWRSQGSLPEYLKEYGIPALSGIDTRRLTITLREKGVMRGALGTGPAAEREHLLHLAQTAPDMSELSAVQQVSRDEGEAWDEAAVQKWVEHVAYDISPVAATPHIVVIDLGTKRNVMRHLQRFGAQVTVVPYDTPAEGILGAEADGVLISNGPGDPQQVPEAVEITKGLIGQVPILGICLGHQILALAAGAETYKLPFGHHGANHPVQNLETGHIEITSHNHNYSVVAESLESLPYTVSHRSLYDGTVEGMRHDELPIVGVQFHPEASPGPHDSLHILRTFVSSLVE